MRAWVAVVATALALTVASCGGNEKFEEGDLKDGRAAGAGFAFTLPARWKSEVPSNAGKRELARVIGKKFPGLDLQGILVAGVWAKPSDRDRRPVVNVAVEPVTRDTTLEAVAAGSEALLRGKGGAVRRVGSPAALNGEAALTIAYRAGERDTQAVIAKRGDYSYTVTVQMQIGHGGDLKALTRRVARAWRWPAPSGRQRSRLASLSRAGGRGYRTTLPPGWRATGRAALRQAGESGGIDSLWRGHVGGGPSTNVSVAVAPVPGRNLDAVLRQVVADERLQARQPGSVFRIDSLRKGADSRIDGERARSIELRSTIRGRRLGQREVVTLHAGRLYRITFSAERARYDGDAGQFDRTLRAWRWAD